MISKAILRNRKENYIFAQNNSDKIFGAFDMTLFSRSTLKCLKEAFGTFLIINVPGIFFNCV